VWLNRILLAVWAIMGLMAISKNLRIARISSAITLKMG